MLNSNIREGNSNFLPGILIELALLHLVVFIGKISLINLLPIFTIFFQRVEN
jgi:hypothetical protein